MSTKSLKPCVRCHSPHASPLAICDACLRPPLPAPFRRCKFCGGEADAHRFTCAECRRVRHNERCRAYRQAHWRRPICRVCKQPLPEGQAPSTLCPDCRSERARLGETLHRSHPLPCGHFQTKTSFHFVNARELEYVRRYKQCNWSDVAVFKPDPKGLLEIARGVYEQL